MSDIEVIPVLPSLDFARTRAFYTDYLGFSVVHEAAGRLILRRETIELHFWLTERPELCAASSCYVRGGGVDALYDTFAAANVPGLGAFEVKPWNMKEFHLLDPDGNLIQFGRIPLRGETAPADRP